MVCICMYAGNRPRYTGCWCSIRVSPADTYDPPRSYKCEDNRRLLRKWQTVKDTLVKISIKWLDVAVTHIVYWGQGGCNDQTVDLT